MGRSDTHLARAVWAVTIAGAAASVFALTTMAGDLSFAILPFAAWALLPFGIVFWGLHRRSLSTPGTLSLLAGSGMGLAVYLSILWPSAPASSTVGLTVLFVPLWQTVWCLVTVIFSKERETDAES